MSSLVFLSGDQELLRSFLSKFEDSNNGFVCDDDEINVSDGRNNNSSLIASNVHLTSIDFMEKMKNYLSLLNLSFNKLSNISALAKSSCVAQLQLVDISHNKIVDLQPLSTCTQLRVLRFLFCCCFFRIIKYN